MFAIIVISFFSYMYPRYSKENELLYESIEKNCKKEYKKEICKEYGQKNVECSVYLYSRIARRR